MSGTTILQDRIREKAYALWEAAGKPEGQAESFWRQAEDEIRAAESDYDKTLADSFPASDPPSSSGAGNG